MMKRLGLVIMVLALLFIPLIAGQSYAVSEKTAYAQFGDNYQKNQSWQEFLSRLYWFVIVAPSGFLMALPWIFWAYNTFKAHTEEDPQAEMKAKRMFRMAIEIDIVLLIIVSGVGFMWFHWIVQG